MRVKERWLDIDFDKNIHEKEIFKVSNHGRIMNCKRYYQNNDFLTKLDLRGNARGSTMYYAFGVMQVSKKPTGRYVHKLVAEHFLERPSEEHKYVLHLDHDTRNNYYKNLKWATNEERIAHQLKSKKWQAYSRNGNAKLSLVKVKMLKRLIARKEAGKINIPWIRLANRFKISHTQLKRIRRGENWASITKENL